MRKGFRARGPRGTLAPVEEVAMDDGVRARVEAALGAAIVGFAPAVGGFSPALRGVATLADGRRAFVKAATDPDTAAWLRAEWRIYGHVESPHVARSLAFLAAEPPILLLEDLSACAEAPPWSRAQVEAVERALAALSRIAAPPEVPPLDPVGIFDGWARVVAEPARFVALGWRDAAWMRATLPRLAAAEARFDPRGEALLHLDLRGDNLRFRDGEAVIFDWNWACRGNPLIDHAFWLPSLHLDGGPAPITRLRDAAAAACVAGFFCWRGSQPRGAMPAGLRAFQRAQGRIALAWAEACLDE